MISALISPTLSLKILFHLGTSSFAEYKYEERATEIDSCLLVLKEISDNPPPILGMLQHTVGQIWTADRMAVILPGLLAMPIPFAGELPTDRKSVKPRVLSCSSAAFT